jgi:hypothetical protein
MPLTEWNELWDSWYQNKVERDQLNARLVIVKTELRGQGIACPRPPTPRPVAVNAS